MNTFSPQPAQAMNYLCALWQDLRTDRQLNHLYRQWPSPDFCELKDCRAREFDDLVSCDFFDTQGYDLAQQLMDCEGIEGPLDLNTNDYLGLQRSYVTTPFDSQLAQYLPVGGLSSRLVGGRHHVYTYLESVMVEMTGFDASLYFSSGMLLNMSLPRLLAELERQATGYSDTRLSFISDEFNHASTIEGLRAVSHVPRIIHNHLDLSSQPVQDMLMNSQSWCDLIFTEGLYSMSGDGHHPEDMAELMIRTPSAVLVADEAHSFATRSGGDFVLAVIKCQGCLRPRCVGVYPMGKAMGCSGAFLAGPRDLIEAAWNLAKPFIYTTSPSPLVAGALLLRLKMIPHITRLCHRLSEISYDLSSKLQSAGYHVQGAGSPFLIIIFGSSHTSVEIAQKCQRCGVMCTAMRYPTVPIDRSCIRLSLHPFLKRTHLDTIVQVLQRSS